MSNSQEAYRFHLFFRVVTATQRRYHEPQLHKLTSFRKKKNIFRHTSFEMTQHSHTSHQTSL